jgi:hypothetical protein
MMQELLRIIKGAKDADLDRLFLGISIGITLFLAVLVVRHFFFT